MEGLLIWCKQGLTELKLYISVQKWLKYSIIGAPDDVSLFASGVCFRESG